MTFASVISRRAASPQRAERGLEAVRHRFARSHPIVALVLYVAGAVVMQQNAVEHIGTTTSGSWLAADSTQFMWAMWWWPHAIVHGLNPFVTHLLWAPGAYNLASVTSSPLPAIALAPVTALAGPIHGPIVSYDIANLAAPVINAWFAYRLCLYLTRAPGASILGGWLYGFSSYGLSPLQGHLQLVFTFVAPALVLLTVRLYRRDTSRLRFVLWAAVALACQALCGTEILFTATVMGVVVLACAYCFSSGNRRPVAALIAPLLAAYLLMGLICAPFLWYALTGPNPQATNGVAPADLLSFVIPTRMTWLGGASLSSVSTAYVANIGEEGTYLGLPLIAIAIAYWWQCFRRPATKVLMIATLVAVIWSLGDVLSVDGNPTIPLPWKLLASHALFKEVLPVRIGVYTALGTALTAALWIAAPGSSRRRWVLGLLAAIFLFPNVDAVDSGHRVFERRYVSPAFITRGTYRRYLHRNEVILPLPFGPMGDSLLWQAQTRGYFRMASGWFGYYPPSYATSIVVAQMSEFMPFTDPVLGMRWFLITHRVGAVVVASGQAGTWPRVMSQLGLRRVSLGGVWLYQVPRELALPLARNAGAHRIRRGKPQ